MLSEWNAEIILLLNRRYINTVRLLRVVKGISFLLKIYSSFYLNGRRGYNQSVRGESSSLCPSWMHAGHDSVIR